MNGEPARSRRGGAFRGFVEPVVILAVAFLLVFGFVRPVVAEARYVGSPSMVPTLKVGDEPFEKDRVLVNKLAYDFSTPERGDIVLFESVGGGEEVLIKRAVGLPGDTIEVRRGFLFVNGERRREPYVNDRTRTRQPPFGPVTVPEGHVFVMGDNRGNSSDSRVFGAVPEEDLIGEAFVRFWPPGRVGIP